jgi:hypothetical protein
MAVTWYQDENDQRSGGTLELGQIAGMAPRTTLLSCKVLRADGSGDVAAVLDALEYIAEVNQGGRQLVVHGVNLSVGYPFDPSWFGTGLTPVRWTSWSAAACWSWWPPGTPGTGTRWMTPSGRCACPSG